jgi:hypothetical protein
MAPSNTPVPQGPKLLDQLRDRIRVKHYSIRTETQYVQWVRRFILFHGKRHPREMGAGKVEAFLSHLARKEMRKEMGSDTINFARDGIRAKHYSQCRAE